MTKRALSFTFLALFLALASLTGCSSDGQDGSGLAVNPLGSSLTNDSHESAASRVAAGEPAVTAVEPPLPTTGHAFTSTAPTASSEEPSSGSADVATVPATIRPAYSWTHENITETAFNDAWNAVFPTLSPRPTEAMKCRLRDIIVSANKKQDSGDAANDLRRHYNRLTSASTFSAKMAVDQAFADYLTAEESLVIRHLTFGAAAPDAWIHADTALQAAGRVLHGYQDFYFHAIRRDGAGGWAFNLRSGFKAWTGSPRQTGNPRNRGNFFPCSWTSIWNPGEHGLGEPVGTGTNEKDARWAAAKEYCQVTLQWFIPAWWSAYGRVYFGLQ